MDLQNFRWTIEDYEDHKETCDQLLNNLKDWSIIPTLNSVPMDTMTEGCLARYQGMVQDIFSPEYYHKNYTVKDKKSGAMKSRSGKFRDILFHAESEELDEESQDMRYQEVRHPLFCIPIPGLNEWAKVSCQSQHPLPTNNMSAGVKRSLENDDEDMEVVEERNIRIKETHTSDEQSQAQSCDQFFPLAEKGGLACILKHYGEHDDFLVNTRIEAVGFLSMSPALEALWQDSDAEDKALHPPPSLVPRLHAIHIRKLSHCNPLLRYDCGDEVIDVKSIRSDLHTVLTQLLCGDTLAADYLICNLIAKTYTRREGLTLGVLSCNIFNIPDVTDYPQRLYSFLQNLVPCSTYLPLTLDLFNKGTFVPRKDYETNRLQSGLLQLSDDTLLLADDTGMKQGELSTVGYKNFLSLDSVVSKQELSYDFTYFNLDFHTNITSLVLSENKSFLTTHSPIKLIRETHASTINETFEAANFFMSGSRLESARKYLSMLRLRNCDMNSTDYVAPAWADLRQQHPRWEQDVLHQLLVIARLLAISSGDQIMTKAHWEKAVAMEIERRARL